MARKYTLGKDANVTMFYWLATIKLSIPRSLPLPGPMSPRHSPLPLTTRVLIGGNRESCIIIVELRFRWPPRKRRPVYSSSEAVGLTRLPRIGRPSHNHPITNERRDQNRPLLPFTAVHCMLYIYLYPTSPYDTCVG